MQLTQKMIDDLADLKMSNTNLATALDISRNSVSKLFAGPYPRKIRNKTHNAIMSLLYKDMTEIKTSEEVLFATEDVARLMKFLGGINEDHRQQAINKFIADNFQSYQQPESEDK